jgi:hypothetical protein
MAPRPHARKSCCRSTGVRKATPVAYRKLELEISHLHFQVRKSQRSSVLTDVPTLQPWSRDLRSLAGDAWLTRIPPTPHRTKAGQGYSDRINHAPGRATDPARQLRHFSQYAVGVSFGRGSTFGARVRLAGKAAMIDNDNN